jgi:Second Messenger Oligonucleotide or Dinucleotide Synthetase domain
MGFLAPSGIVGNPLTGGFVPPVPPVNNLLAPFSPAPSVLSLLAQPPATHRWFFVRQRFTQFLANLNLTVGQIGDGVTKHSGVVATLNRAYRGVSEGATHCVLIGSWGKGTQVRPPRDIDLLFILPVEVYYRFQQRQGNVQSQLLQEVRDVLRATYPTTGIRGDGQVVTIPFGTYQVEVAPAFLRQGGGYLVCDTHFGGRYKHVDPDAELAALTATDTYYNGNVRKLTRLLKQWQQYCNVPIKSFHLEAAIKGLLPKVTYSGNDEFWFDWLARDAFAHLIGCANGSFIIPVTGETISVGDQWLSRAQSAYERAVKACDYEYNNEQYLAGVEWQKIFGTMIPAIVM